MFCQIILWKSGRCSWGDRVCAELRIRAQVQSGKPQQALTYQKSHLIYAVIVFPDLSSVAERLLARLHRSSQQRRWSVVAEREKVRCCRQILSAMATIQDNQQSLSTLRANTSATVVNMSYCDRCSHYVARYENERTPTQASSASPNMPYVCSCPSERLAVA